MQNKTITHFFTKPIPALFLFVLLCFLYACGSSGEQGGAPMAEELPVLTVSKVPATTYREFSASLEGSNVVELRPQVDGYLDEVYVDEGAYVQKGQSLFRINDRPYREQLNTAKAALAAAKANFSNAQINLSKTEPLVKSKVVSDVQLKAAQAASDAASANVAQAQAQVENAEINLGYTLIKAPVDGYIGRIPFKTGSLVGLASPQALTVISEISEIHAYFSLSETDFIQFKNQFPGATIEEKIKGMPPVELVLADNSLYNQKGKVELVSGQFDHRMGTITFRSAFKNTEGLLRSGNTGKIRISRNIPEALLIPQEATYELQDKVFVFILADSNKVVSTPLRIADKRGNYYLVEQGLKPGQKIVYAGLDRLRDGAVIKPMPLSMDSLLKMRPL
jgi:membrane fusion protein (multidrug efflux system)